MNLVEEYKKSLKMVEVEEILDLIFNRPIAFGLVKMIYRLPVTPNQITLLSLVAGLCSGYYFSTGSPAMYGIAGLWYMIANLLDCSDGQLARLQHSGTPLGRLVDGIVDWIVSVAIFVGLGIGIAAQTTNPAIWYLVVAGGISSALHAIFFDYYQQEYLSNVRGEENFLAREITKAESERTALKRDNAQLLRQWILVLYLRYLNVQNKSQFKKGTQQQFPPESYRQMSKQIMRWWTFLGPTTNRSLLMVAGFLHQPELFLWVVVIPGNLYLVYMLLWQRKVQHLLETTFQSTIPAEQRSEARL